LEFSLSLGERQRLASLLAAVVTLLLLFFVLAVALPLLPLKLADPFWQLAFTAALCSNGFLALLAVLLLNLAAALLPEADWLLGRRQLVAGLCRWVAFAFLLLIPLQGLAAWRALDWAAAIESRGARQELSRIAQFRQAVASAGSVSALQVNLAAIQAPPLGPEDQRQGLAALKASLLGQLQTAEQRARASSGGQAAAASGSVSAKALDPAQLLALGKDSLRVVLLSLGLALAFAAAAQRRGSELSLRAEWRLAFEGVLEAGRLWQQERRENWEERRQLRQEQQRSQRLRQHQQHQRQAEADHKQGVLPNPRGRPHPGHPPPATPRPALTPASAAPMPPTSKPWPLNSGSLAIEAQVAAPSHARDPYSSGAAGTAVWIISATSTDPGRCTPPLAPGS
jgi:hypothetical protein